MSNTKPCQHCCRFLSQKRITVQVHVKDLSAGTYGESLAGVDYKFELCDLCAAAFMDEQSERARNFALDLTAEGKQRRAIPAETGVVVRTPVDPTVLDVEEADYEEVAS